MSDHRQAMMREYTQPSRLGGVRRIENRLRSKTNGYRWQQWSTVPERDLIYCLARDVTAEKDQAAALQQAEEQLRQRQKMDAIGQLTGGIAHDFNNMLAVVIRGLNLLQRRLSRGDTNVDGLVEGAIDGAMRASSLTRRLLAFSRQQTLAPAAVDAGRMITGMLEPHARRTYYDRPSF